MSQTASQGGRPDVIWPRAEDSHRDDLTGLPNRRFVVPQLQALLRRAQESRSTLCLLLIDVDDFKRASQTFGRQGGDTLLKALARRLESLAGNNDCLVRFAGDEFALVMPGRRREEAARFAEHIRRHVRDEPFQVNLGTPVMLTVSLGVAEGPTDGDTVRGLIEATDAALEAAKDSGRDRVGVAGEISSDVPHIRRLLGGFPCPRFVGRVNALARCAAMSHLGERGPTTLVLVQSATGFGRSRLVMEVARRRAEGGDLTLWTSCRPELQRSPYAPLADMMRQLATRHPSVIKAAIEAIGPTASAILARRFAPFGAGADARHTAEVSTEWRSKFFSTVMTALGYLGREHQLAVVLDDIQYADPATLKVLTFLLRHDRQDQHGAGLPIFATISNRAIERPATGSAFATFWRFVSSWPTVGVVTLGPLHVDEVTGIVDACFPGHRFQPEFAGFIHHLTGGIPMFVQEVLIVLALSGFIERVGTTWRLDKSGLSALPTDLQTLLSKRMEMLDPETSAALSNAAVLGSQFSVGLLQTVLDTNEGHATDLTDMALDHRLLVHAGNGSDTLQFAAKSIRDLTYESVDEATRRSVHGKVSQLKEHFEVVDMDDALAEVAFHAEREGDQARIAHSRARQQAAAQRLYRAEESEQYFTRAGTENAPRIDATTPEVTTPLGQSALEHLPAVLKALMNVQRGIQMYPPGSQYIQNALQDCLTAARALMAEGTGLTVKERGGELEFNGVVLPIGDFGQIGEDVVETLRRAHVHSVTFSHALTGADIETFGQGATRFGAKGYTSREGDWARLLRERKCHGLGIVPRKYRATSDGESLANEARLEGLASEAARHLPLLKDILRFTAGTAEATLLYPKGSETVRRAVEGLEKTLAQAHAYLSSVNLGVTSDGFLVNDLRLDVRTFGAAVQAMHQVLSRSGAESLSFKSGVTELELETLFRYLGSERSTTESHLPWAQRLAALGIRRIGVDEYVFVAADAQGADEAEPVVEERPRWSALNRDALLKRVLEDEPLTLLEGDLRTALPDLLTDLVLDEEDDLVEAIVARFYLIMQEPDPAHRAACFELLGALTSETSRIVAEAVTRYSTDYVTVQLRLERVPRVLTQLVVAAERVADLHLRSGDLRAASRILWQLGKGLQVDPGVDETIRAATRESVGRLMRSQPFERALHALWTPNEKRRALVLHLLEGCGTEAIDRLFELAYQATDEGRVQVHAEQLASIATRRELEERLLMHVNPFDAPAEVMRTLELAEAVRCASETLLVRAFQHRQTTVLDAVSRLVSRMRPAEAEPILQRLARSSEPRVRTRVVQLVGQLAPRTAVELVSDFLWDESSQIALRIDCCVALGRSNSTAAIEPLRALLTTSRWTRWLDRDEPSEIRAAAAWALGTMRNPEALACLESFRDDHDPGVREAVEVVLPEDNRGPDEPEAD